MSLLESSKGYFKKLIIKNNLYEKNISVLARPLTTEEAIGEPGRRDFPIVEGKERILEAKFEGIKGHAFTDSAKEFKGELQQILDLSLINNQNRAIYTAALNSVMNYLHLIEGTVHCKNDQPEKCAKQIAELLFEKFEKKQIGLIGLNPAIADELLNAFGDENVIVTDLYKNNMKDKKILNGREFTNYLIENSDIILLTGTTIVNDSFASIFKEIQRAKKQFFVYGVAAAAICKINNFNRLCPFSTNE